MSRKTQASKKATTLTELVEHGKIDPMFVNAAIILTTEMFRLANSQVPEVLRKELPLSLIRAGNTELDRTKRLYSCFEYYSILAKLHTYMCEKATNVGRKAGLYMFEKMNITSEEFDIIEDGCVEHIRRSKELEDEYKKEAIARTVEMVHDFRDLLKELRYAK